MYWSDGFWTEVPRASIFKHRQEARHSWRTFSQPYAACTPPNSRLTHSTIFARLQCSHSCSCIWSEQHSCYLFQATSPTQSHQHFVILKSQRRCSDAATPGRRYAKEAKGSTRWSNGEGQHWDLRQLPWLMQHCVHAEGCSQDAWARRSVKRGAAGKVALLQCSKWVFSFCNEFFPRSLPGWREGKIQQVPEKIGTNPGKNSVAGAGPLGRSGLRVQSTQGQELWVKIGNQCSDFT